MGGQAYEIQKEFIVIKRALIPISVLLGIVSILFIWFGEPDNVSALTREDGVVENLSAIFYMVGLFVSFISIFKAERILFPILWAALCFVFLGEETSWFQRIFHYSVPEVEQINAQNEFNLHNLDMFQGGRLTNPTFGLSDFFKSQNFAFFIMLYVIAYIWPTQKIQPPS